MKRYHWLLITLHWLLAVMIIMGLVMGSKVLSQTANSDPQKIVYLKIHMSMGLLILVLMSLRFIVRMFSSKPQPATIGSPALNRLAALTHYLFYLLVILLALSGLSMANMTGLPDIIFGGSQQSLPISFDDLPVRKAHGAIALALGLLIAAHVAAFMYHQFVFKDKLFSRMWFTSKD